jgi:hypothetical protein
MTFADFRTIIFVTIDPNEQPDRAPQHDTGLIASQVMNIGINSSLIQQLQEQILQNQLSAEEQQQCRPQEISPDEARRDTSTSLQQLQRIQPNQSEKKMSTSQMNKSSTMNPSVLSSSLVPSSLPLSSFLLSLSPVAGVDVGTAAVSSPGNKCRLLDPTVLTSLLLNATTTPTSLQQQEKRVTTLDRSLVHEGRFIQICTKTLLFWFIGTVPIENQVGKLREEVKKLKLWMRNTRKRNVFVAHIQMIITEENYS